MEDTVFGKTIEIRKHELKELLKDGKVMDLCTECMCEVELENELKKQICPNCGKSVFPCASCCPVILTCAVNCPLDKK